MPIYEFKCPDCKTVVDKLVRLSETDKICTCECGALMEKTMGSFLSAVHGLPNGHIASRAKK